VLRRCRADSGEELEEVACPLCGCERSTLALQARDLLFDKPGMYKLVHCDRCALRYVNPRPTAAALGAHYPDDYHCYRPIEDAPRWMQPMARFEERQQASGRLKSIERVLGRLKADLEILDVGCGRNGLLHYIQQKRGTSGLGIELKPETAAYVRDQLHMPVIEGTLLDSKLASERFDLAVMLEYLEHEPDPLRVLAETRRVLKRGGHVVIEIPDPEGAPARTFGSRWVNLDLPRHLVFFDRNTLKQALAKTGFEVVSHRRFGIPLYIGYSLMLGLGAKHIMRHWEAFSAVSYTLGAALLPALPWLPEFSFVIARAK
jgi:SAM-dependent methyltransferase